MKSVIAWQVEKISELLDGAERLPVDRLRDEAVALQVLLAEAAHQQRAGAPREAA